MKTNTLNMKQVIELIKQKIAECEKNGDMFSMPSIDRSDVEVNKTELEPQGSSLYRKEYNVKFADGGWIHIEYASKDRCRSFQVRPDRSVIEVTCSDSTLNFSDGWDENN